MAEENRNNSTETTSGVQDPEEKEINILEIVYKLWSQKKVILIWMMWGVIAGLIIAFSIPKEYTTEVKLAPEFKADGGPLSGGLGALASMAGISTSANSGSDAVYPELYPEIVESVPFLMTVLNTSVVDSEGDTFTVKEYLRKKTKKSLAGYVMALPGMAIKAIVGTKPDAPIDSSLNKTNPTFQISKQDDGLINALKYLIKADVDKKTEVITITARMQDPMVSAVLADSVVALLRNYITDYRTDKARQDLIYALQLNDEAQEEYYKAQQRLADYTDRNQNLATQSARVTRDRLENEASLAFNLYNETSLHVQNAKSRVQEITPVYTVIKPATVPLKASRPRKGLILAGFVFLAFCGSCAWILFGKPLVSEYKEKVKELKDADNGENTDSGSDSNKNKSKS